MIVEVNGQIWADTVSVQAAVSRFYGRHIGGGDFAISVGPETAYFFRTDSTIVSNAIAREHNFIGRSHRVEGDTQAITTMIKEIQNGV